MALDDKVVLITGAARRLGRHLALTAARAGADILLHHSNSPDDAQTAAEAIAALGRKVWVLQADFRSPHEVETFASRAFDLAAPFALVHNASIFEPLGLEDSSLDEWQQHLNINLTAPFLLSREFARRLPPGTNGRMITMLDWRALRPGADHFPYTITKAALAAMTRSMADALAPRITVNGLALGAILPPADGSPTDWVDTEVPARRWATLDELAQAFLFLLDGPAYITGEILHLDGGRHLR
jgi:pteridine reductase